MKKVLMLVLCSSMLLTSCGTYTTTGAMLGGTIGSAIGGITGGRHGHGVGTLIGMAAGAAVGASVEAAEQARAEKAAQDQYIRHREAYARDYYKRNGVASRSKNQSANQSDGVYSQEADPSKYVDPTNSGDDRIEMK